MYPEEEVQGMDLTHNHVKEWKEYARDGSSVTFECETDTGRGIDVRIDILTDSILRLRFVPDTVDPTPSEIPLRDEWDETEYTIRENNTEVEIETEALVCRVAQLPWQLTIYGPDDEVLCEEALDDFDAHDYRRSLLPGYTTNFKDEIVGVNESFTLGNDESFFGLGEKFTDFDKRGQTITCENKNPYGSGTEEAHKNIPFLLSSRGFGVFLNTTYRNVWELGSRSNASYSIYSEDDHLDLFVMYDGSPKGILEKYTALTGKPSMPPKWSFGLNQWSFTPDGKFALSQDRVEELAATVRSAELPCDMMFLTTSSWNDLITENYDMKFDQDRYPDPDGFRETLDQLNFKLIGSIMPFLPVSSGIYNQALENGFLLEKPDGSPAVEPVFHESHLRQVKEAKREGWIDSDRTTPWPDVVTDRFTNPGVTDPLDDLTRSYKWRWEGKDDYYGPGGFVDFTNPDAVEWWQSKVAYALEEEGFDGFMTDFAEETPRDAVYHNGKTGNEMYNFYPMLYQEANYEAFERTDKEPFVRARSGYAGLQQYPVCWPGDPNPTFNAMHSVLRGGLSLAVSGVPFWMNYVGAHTGRPSDELFIRWSQCAMFASHADPGVNNPLSYSEEITDIYRRYAALRYRLLPYIYSYAHQATETGCPLMRPLFLEYQNDSRTYDLESEYLLGEELLAAPVLRESTDGTGEIERDVYLPEGEWLGYWNGSSYEGPTTISYTAPLDELPLFVKSDAIIPMIEETTYIGEKSFDPVILDVYLRSHATFTLYDDDERVEIEASRSGEEITFDLSASTKEYRLQLRGIEEIEAVRVDDEEVSEYDSRAVVPEETSGWWSGEDGTSVEFDAGGSETRVTITTE